MLTGLSVPYAIRAHDLDGRLMDPENIARVDRLLADIEFDVEVDKQALTTEKGLERGQRVLVSKCTACHDMRTILIKPRTASGWHNVNVRMLEKPAVFGEALTREDIPWVTAYLVAITPEIQESLKHRREDSAAEKQRADAVGEAVHQADQFEVDALDATTAEALYKHKCTDCHESDEVEEHRGDDLAGWRSVVAAMVEEGATVTDEEAVQIATYLANQFPPVEAIPSAMVEPAPLEPKPRVKKAPAKPDSEAEADSEAKADSEAEADREADREAESPPTPEATKPKPAAEPGGDAAPAKPKADAAAGKTLFLAKCKSCHGSDGRGETAYGEKIGVPNLVTSSLSASKLEGVIRNGVSGTKMKAYGGKLSDEEIANVLAWIRGLK